MQIRLNAFLAACGVCARRKADDLIAAGVVTIDGRVATLGESINPTRNSVAVRGRRVALRNEEPLTLVLNKPRGVVTTMSDERGRPSVAGLLPKDRRLFPVGRLDAQTTGVLLCTGDGDLARILTHPSFGVEKRYRVTASGSLTAASIKALGALGARQRAGSWVFDVILKEGKNRQVRRMCAQAGLRVIDLERVKFGPIELRGLAPGKTRALTKSECAALDQLRIAAQIG